MSSHPAPVTRRYVILPSFAPHPSSSELRRMRLARLEADPPEREQDERFDYLKRTHD